MSLGNPKCAAWSPWRCPISRRPTLNENSPRRPGPAVTPGQPVTSAVISSLAVMTQAWPRHRAATIGNWSYDLTTQGAQHFARAAADVLDQGTHGGQAGAQLGVADLDRHHRILQLDERIVGLLDAVDRAIEQGARAARGRARPARRERPHGQRVALREARVRALRAAVRLLDGAEELLLHA